MSNGRKGKGEEEKVPVSVNIPRSHVERLKELVDEGVYETVSDAVRHAILLLLKRDRKYRRKKMIC